MHPGALNHLTKILGPGTICLGAPIISALRMNSPQIVDVTLLLGESPWRNWHAIPQTRRHNLLILALGLSPRAVRVAGRSATYVTAPSRLRREALDLVESVGFSAKDGAFDLEERLVVQSFTTEITQ